jgi:hypothetical protein
VNERTISASGSVETVTPSHCLSAQTRAARSASSWSNDRPSVQPSSIRLAVSANEKMSSSTS